MARPRTFDEVQILDAICKAFWTNGYERTSTRDLVKLTGLGQPSLYAAFGDKRQLFRRALEHYLDHTLRQSIDRLESTLPPAQAIAAYLGEVVDCSAGDAGQRGCLLINSVLEAADDEDFRAAMAAELEQIRSFFRRCLLAARRASEIPGTPPATDAAAQLLTVVLGLRVLARLNPDRALLRAAASTTLNLLGLPILPAAPRRAAA